MTSPISFHHVILTRFNCSNSYSSKDREIAIRSRPGWMEERFELFERYCLPSVISQTDQNFEWRIYFDRQTPSTYLERAERDIAGRSNIRLILCDIFGSETVREDLARDLPPQSGGWLLTTRFDNDDALHRQFVEKLHREVHPGVVEALNFPLGVVYGEGKAYLSRQECNAFISLSESMDHFQTVLSGPHNEMALHTPVRDIDSGPAWLQVVHLGNVSNKLRGRRLPAAQLLEGFETVDLGLNGRGRENALGIAIENLTLVRARDLRDRALRLLRQVRR